MRYWGGGGGGRGELVFVLQQVLYGTEEIQVFVLYQVLCGTEEMQVFVTFKSLSLVWYLRDSSLCLVSNLVLYRGDSSPFFFSFSACVVLRRIMSLSCIKSFVVWGDSSLCLVSSLVWYWGDFSLCLVSSLMRTEEMQVFVLYHVLCGTDEILAFVLCQVLCNTEDFFFYSFCLASSLVWYWGDSGLSLASSLV